MNSQINKLVTRTFLLLSFFLPFVLIFNYMMNHWYISGAYLLDTGFLSFLSSHASFPDMARPPIFGGSYLSTHFSPIFWITTWLRTPFTSLSDQVYFSILQALWIGALGAAVFHISFKLSGNYLASWLTAFFSALNGVALAVVGYPHIDQAIPVLIIIYLTIQSSTKKTKFAAGIALALLFSIREDAGLHAFGLLITIAVFFLLMKERQKCRAFFIPAMICLTYSVAIVVIQNIAFSEGDSSLARIYTGTPPYAHINFDILWERILFHIHHRKFILLPLAVAIIYSLARKDWLLLLGTLTTIPWLLFSLTATYKVASHLSAHYSFPVMVFLLWPTVSGSFNRISQASHYVYLQAFLCAMSFILLPGSAELHDKNPIKSVGFEYLGHVHETDKAIKIIQENISEFGRVAVDDAIAAFLPGTISSRQWRDTGKFSSKERLDLDTVIYFNRSWLSGVFRQISAEGKFRHFYSFPYTQIIVASKLDLKKLTSSSSLLEFPKMQRQFLRPAYRIK